jgi:two-component system NarL family response regulator
MGIRVLLADDCPHVLTMYRLTLELEDGVDIVGVAGDGDEAIDQALALQPDAVVLDLDMPHRSGLASIAAIRDAAPDAAIVVCSSNERALAERQAFDNGAAAYLDKVTDLHELAAVLMLVAHPSEVASVSA